MNLWLDLIFGFATMLNAGTAALLFWLSRRWAGAPRWLGPAAWVWAALMCELSAIQVFAPYAWSPFLQKWLYFPLATEMVWTVLFLQFFFLGLILAVLVTRRFSPASKSEVISVSGMSRRKFLYLASYGAVPTIALGMGVHGSITRNELRVRSFTIPVTGLPSELEGFTIAHVSDLHSGLFVGPDRLKIISDATNDLKAGLIAITGDVINARMTEFPPALEAMKRMESRYGTFLCEGNHDRIPGPGRIVEACDENQLPMLFNQARIIPVEGRRLILGGLPWIKHGFEGHSDIVRGLYPKRQEGDVRVLLAHHPHLFDISEDADLVLAGHTHGGQIMAGPVGLGPIFFKYWSGLYHQGNTTMIVSNGCGDWFPCRIGAPAEIGLLKLTRAG